MTTRPRTSRAPSLLCLPLTLAVCGVPLAGAKPHPGDSDETTLVLVERSSGLGNPTREEGRTEFEVADIDGDGQLEILSVGDHGSPNVNSTQKGITLYRGNGGSSWTSWQSGNFGYGGCAVGDLDLDGNMDIAWGIHHDWGVPGFGGELMGAALGDGTASSWTPWGTGLATNGETWGMFSSALADFDEDGDLDLVSQSFGSGNGVRLYRNNRDGTWTQAWAATGGNVSFTIEAADVNADGHMDIVCTRFGSNVFLGDGAFGFTQADSGLPASLSGVHVGDMDRDGDDDLVLCTGGGVRCYRFDATTASWTSASTGLPDSGGYNLSQFGDLDGDGLLDVVAYRDREGRVFLGDGAGTWTPDATFTMPAPGDGSALRVDGDIDHDGRDDIVVAAEKSGFPVNRNQLQVFSPWLAPVALAARVVEPTGGETLAAGSSREIRWRAAVPPADGPASVDLELSISGATGPWTALASGLPDNGRWQWLVNDVTSASCRVRVTVTSASGSDSSVSPTDFAITGGTTPVPLMASTATLPEAGGTVDFTLDAGAGFANRGYILFATASGTSPGLPLPGGSVTLPINFDWLTILVIKNLKSPALTNFAGTLDASGQATAQLAAPPFPGAAGLLMHFAFATRGPYDFASNAVSVTVVP